MPHRFNVGDRVRCIDPHGSVGPLIRDQIYTISVQNGINGAGNFIYRLEEMGNLSSYAEFRFELVQDAAPVVPERSVIRWCVVYKDSEDPEEVNVGFWKGEDNANRFAQRREQEGRLLSKKKITLRY